MPSPALFTKLRQMLSLPVVPLWRLCSCCPLASPVFSLPPSMMAAAHGAGRALGPGVPDSVSLLPAALAPGATPPEFLKRPSVDSCFPFRDCHYGFSIVPITEQMTGSNICTVKILTLFASVAQELCSDFGTKYDYFVPEPALAGTTPSVTTVFPDIRLFQ